jgi:hypothetical protein
MTNIVVDPYWASYTFRLALTGYDDILAEFKTGDVITPESGELLALVLNEKDKKEGKGQWHSEVELPEWSLNGCFVFFHGDNNTGLPTKGNMQKVLILDFPADSVKPVGRLFFTYNVGG